MRTLGMVLLVLGGSCYLSVGVSMIFSSQHVKTLIVLSFISVFSIIVGIGKTCRNTQGKLTEIQMLTIKMDGLMERNILLTWRKRNERKTCLSNLW